MTENQELYCVMDDTDAAYAYEHPEIKHGPILETDLLILQLLLKDEDCRLDPDDRLAKLKQELAAHGLTITPDTDINALADVIRTLGIADY